MKGIKGEERTTRKCGAGLPGVKIQESSVTLAQDWASWSKFPDAVGVAGHDGLRHAVEGHGVAEDGALEVRGDVERAQLRVHLPQVGVGEGRARQRPAVVAAGAPTE